MNRTGSAAGLTAAASPRPLFGRLSPWLAPLAGHSDLVFRTLCREQGAAVACTEMVSAKGLVYGEGKKTPAGGLTRGGASATRELLRTAATDAPLVVQLFGEDPDFLGRAVELLRAWGFGWFDLNLGCSVPKVLKTGAGAALARSIPATLAAARAMIAAAGPIKESGRPNDMGVMPPAGSRPPRGRVGFKLRLGWSREEENYQELAAELEQCGAGWITLHPRYARQGFGGQADARALESLARRLEIPLLASGDLFEAAAALDTLEQSGATGLMFARGAMHNPAIFRDYLHLAGGALPVADERRAALAPDFLRTLILRHAELAVEFENGLRKEPASAGKREKEAGRPESSLLKMRGAVPRYVRDLPGSRAFRVNLSTCRSWEHFYRLVEEYFASLPDFSTKFPNF